MSVKSLIIGIPTQKGEEIVNVISAEDSPSLFDFDIVCLDVDDVLPYWCQKDCKENDYVRIEDESFYQITKLMKKLEKEVIFLMKKGGTMVCLLRPRRGVYRRYHTDIGYQNAYVDNYEWLPFGNIGHCIEYGSGEEIEAVADSHFF